MNESKRKQRTRRIALMEGSVILSVFVCMALIALAALLVFGG